MGLTYKENVPDTRETPVVDLIRVLKEFGVEMFGYDPLLTREQVAGFGVEPVDELKNGIDAVVAAVGHEVFRGISLEDLAGLMGEKPVIVDVRGIFRRNDEVREGCVYCTL
jgi:UDPglucose 6-dehydrogenase/UDP-N-acetyl-D-galactosamine dehydrogenase